MESTIDFSHLSCRDFQQFQNALRQMRLVDDRLIHKLNAVIPTDSFKSKMDATSNCKEFHDKLSASFKTRENMIKSCINELASDVTDLRSKKEKDPDDYRVAKQLRSTQTNLRLMKQELTVEEVVKDRTLRVFNERCRDYYSMNGFS